MCRPFAMHSCALHHGRLASLLQAEKAASKDAVKADKDSGVEKGEPPPPDGNEK